MKYWLFIIGIFLLNACSSSPTLDNKRSPSLSLTEFFSGKFCAWGLVKSSGGELTRKFVAKIDARSKENSFELDEQFIFDDGEKQNRLWQFIYKDNQWVGTAGDVEGKAVGNVSGDTFHLVYDLNVKIDENHWTINMDDWLYLVDENTMMGTTTMKKWGFVVGEINITMQKNAQSHCRLK